VASTVAPQAMISEFLVARRMLSLSITRRYQSKEKPVHSVAMRLALKDSTTSTTMGR